MGHQANCAEFNDIAKMIGSRQYPTKAISQLASFIIPAGMTAAPGPRSGTT
jgi:hypothetical protein